MNSAPQAPWESTDEKDMILAHFSPAELASLDVLQGGTVVDGDGFRSYKPLKSLLKDKKFHDTLVSMLKESNQQPNHSFRKDQKFLETTMPHLFHKTEGERDNPVIRNWESKGNSGDTREAWVPFSLIQVAMEIGYKPKFNRKTGFLEFGWGGFFKPFARVAAPVAAVIAAPFTGGGSLAAIAGSAAMAGAASYLAHRITGASHKESIRPLIGSVLGGAGAAIAPMMGIAPFMGMGFGQAAGQMLAGASPIEAAQQGLAYGAAHYGLGKLGEAGYLPGGMGAKGAGAAATAQQAAAPALNPSASAAKTVLENSLKPASWLDKATDTLMSPSFLGPTAVAGLAYLGEKKQHKHDVKHHREALEFQRQRKEEAEEHRRRSGFYDPWNPPTYARKRRPYHAPSLMDMKHGIFDPIYEDEAQPYNQGGMVQHPDHDQSKLQSVTESVLIKGPGKGQADLIKTTVPENSYIIDASTTGMFGDGSSEAGAQVLQEFQDQIRKRFPKHHGLIISEHLEQKTPQLPVWLSNDEFKFDPVTVTMLGKGSNVKGAAMLKQMVKNIRAAKAKRGGGLPVKAKSPWDYLPKGAQLNA